MQNYKVWKTYVRLTNWVKKFFLFVCFRYLQIRHFFLQEVRSSDSADPSIITQLFIDAYDLKDIKGIIGKLYKSFMVMNKNTTNYIKQ